uniref:Uncharacterized protein n=1 Tax=Oryza sativa subsp. japonica TaxID=39947 RepID=Q6ZJA5_ORYSJ|nr:hypothetical protein [Oryza sativa Japonica Group]
MSDQHILNTLGQRFVHQYAYLPADGSKGRVILACDENFFSLSDVHLGQLPPPSSNGEEEGAAAAAPPSPPPGRWTTAVSPPAAAVSPSAARPSPPSPLPPDLAEGEGLTAGPSDHRRLPSRR